jgi:hypothetical protein
MDEQVLKVLQEMRDLLQLIAEPQIAVRDRRQRDSLRGIAGKGEKTRKAVLLMDGSRKQKDIASSVPMSPGQLSDLVKELRANNLVCDGVIGPKITIHVTKASLEGVGASE